MLKKEKMDGIERIRLSSVEIVELNNEMINIIKNNSTFLVIDNVLHKKFIEFYALTTCLFSYGFPVRLSNSVS